jgi:hypothetical protein
MAILTVSRGGTEIPDGVYEALLQRVEPQEPTPNSPNPKPWLKWIFTIYDGSDEGQDLTAASSVSLNPKSKAYGWVQAVLQRRLEPGEQVDTDALAQRECQVILKKDQESGFVRVQDVLSPRRAPGKPSGAAGVAV